MGYVKKRFFKIFNLETVAKVVVIFLGFNTLKTKEFLKISLVFKCRFLW